MAPPDKRVAPIAMESAAFRAIGHELVDAIATFLDTLPSRPLTRDHTPVAVRALLGNEDGLPTAGSDPAELIASTTKLLCEHSLFNGHPKFMGYITSSPAPIGMLAELLAAAVNQNTGAWRLSPVASAIEAQTIRWLAELVGLPSGGGGLLVSGGNMANMVALFAARTAAATWDVQREGVHPTGAAPLRVYATREAHTWLHKAVDMAGLGAVSISWIDTDADQRMNVDALARALDHDRAGGALPMMVIATAGTVSTGAIDPLRDIGRVCAAHKVWMHVDGCYGALAACVPGTPEDLRAMPLADSVALDPHKWLYAPLEAGALLVRAPETLRRTFAHRPPYYHFGQEALSYLDYGPQNSRGFRALKVWLALRHVGRDGYVRMIGDDIRLSRWLADRVDEHPELELFTQSLSIATFRFVPEGSAARPGADSETDAEREAYLDSLNQEIVERIQRSGASFLSNAVVNGRYALRPCIVNFRTTQADLEEVLEQVVELGRQVHGALQGSGG